jgi:hypothetical protein
MRIAPHAFRNLAIVACAAFAGAFVGLIIGYRNAPRHEPVAHKLPLPHHLPKYSGGVSLRFAMAHDVIHERFPRHSAAYYEERNRVARAELEKVKAADAQAGKPSDRYWELLDDIAVGIDLLGRHQEAVAMMRDKLEQQKKLGMTGRALYSSYANLGTFLILWQIQEGFADKERAKPRITESIELIRQAVEVKPDAHFGREMWQSVLEQFIVAVLDDPQLLLKYDMVGNQLDQTIDAVELRSLREPWSDGRGYDAQAYLQQDKPDEKQADLLRRAITRVGAEKGWIEAVPTSHKEPVAFDEPTLGIIGMWRYGGGANPHFALALGEIMLRVGQRYIAWTAYERAAQMANVFPEPISKQFAEHCQKRQQAIEATLPADEVAKFRPRFEKELAFGRAYQKAYQDYEAKRIGEGASIDDPHFYDAFEKERGSIASPVGEEDYFVIDKYRLHGRQGTIRGILPCVLLVAGIFAFPTACLLRYLNRPGKSKAA